MEKRPTLSARTLNQTRAEFVGCSARLTAREVVDAKRIPSIVKKGLNPDKKREYVVHRVSKDNGRYIVDAQCMENDYLSIKKARLAVFADAASCNTKARSLTVVKPCGVENCIAPEIIKRYKCQASACSKEVHDLCLGKKIS